MMHLRFLTVAATLSVLASALPYNLTQIGFNLYQNTTASVPLDYSGQWPDHIYQPSPRNWRMPIDPTNDDANGTQFEHDITSTQLRHGGDIKGLQNTVDYLQGMGIKTIYLAGSPMINLPWASDGYSPLDLTLLDAHFGNIDTWRDAISDIHTRGMYVILDNTFSTLGDLLAFTGFLNASAPFNPSEYDGVWKSDRRYADFKQSDKAISRCDYPRFWGDDGHLVDTSEILIGCRDSDFDQYGDVSSTAQVPEYVRQLSKFASVQDRLRERNRDVLAKIQLLSCLTVSMLDIDGFRIDKATQITVDSQGACSRSLWLWLGVLDSFQGVGFGMILLHTLTRFHIAFTLITAQVLGATATICARGFALHALGSKPVFPNLAVNTKSGLRNAWFWITLLFQLSVCGAAFSFFRQGQSSKP